MAIIVDGGSVDPNKLGGRRGGNKGPEAVGSDIYKNLMDPLNAFQKGSGSEKFMNSMMDKLDNWAGIDKAGTDLGFDDNGMLSGKGGLDSVYQQSDASAQFQEALNQRMQGRGPSMAQQQAGVQREAGINQLAAQRASQRGVNPALAARLQQQQSANLSGQISQQAIAGRLQEQNQAQGQLGQFLGQQNQLSQQAALASRQQQLQAALQRESLVAQGKMFDTQGKREIHKAMAENTSKGMGGGMGAGAITGKKKAVAK